MTMTATKWKLCYVEHGVAWFTDAPLEDQWGDDWDDAPWEHNAGTPYAKRPEREDDKNGNLRSFVFCAADDLDPPGSGQLNSTYSVQDINAGRVSWLWNGEKRLSLFAGASVEEFAEFVERSGGCCRERETP